MLKLLTALDIAMKKIQKMLIVLSALITMSIYADTFQPTFPKFNFVLSEQVKRHELKQLKAAQFNHGIHIPFYQIGVLHPWTEGFLYDDIACAKTGCRFHFSIVQSEAEKLKLFQIPGLGYILVPRDWHRFEAEVASNGSADFRIQNTQASQAIDMLNTANCYGCALTSGSLYFPKLQSLLDLEDYSGLIDHKKYLHLVYAKPNRTFFSYQIPKHPYRTHGVAFYQDQAGLNFQKIELTLANPKLANIILNFYNFQLHLSDHPQ